MLTAEVGARMNIKVDLEVSPIVDEVASSECTRHTVHALREILSNIVRHSRASAVRVDVEADETNGLIVVTVNDNGVGFSNPWGRTRSAQPGREGPGTRWRLCRRLGRGAVAQWCDGPRSSRTDMIRLLLVDDHEIVRRGLSELLESQGDLQVVAQAGSLAEALDIDLEQIDVAVLDVRLPDGSGVDLCRTLHERRPDLGCLMLTSFPDNEAINASVLAGAKGYVLKNVRGDELVTAIRRVANGEMLLSAEQIERCANACAARSPRTSVSRA